MEAYNEKAGGAVINDKCLTFSVWREKNTRKLSVEEWLWLSRTQGHWGKAPALRWKYGRVRSRQGAGQLSSSLELQLGPRKEKAQHLLAPGKILLHCTKLLLVWLMGQWSTPSWQPNLAVLFVGTDCGAMKDARVEWSWMISPRCQSALSQETTWAPPMFNRHWCWFHIV